MALLAYAAKYASACYGPFREAVESTLRGTGRPTSRIRPTPREALREVALDVAEGADLVMVKPALPYLDVIAAVRGRSPVPVAAYQVSGEYAMVEAAAGARLAGPGPGDPGEPHLDPTGRRPDHPQLLGGGGGPVAAVTGHDRRRRP